MAVKVNRKALGVLLVVILAAAVGTFSVLRWVTDKEARSAQFLREARVLADQGQYAQAVIQYRSAIANNPTNVGAHLELAEIYVRLGDPVRAYEYYKSASTQDPTNVGALLKLAGLYHLAGKWDDLRKASALIVSLAPGGTTEAQAHHYLAQCYYRDGDYAQSAAEFARAAEMNKGDLDAILSQALLNYQKLGAPRDAELALKTLLARAEDASLGAVERAEAALRAAKYFWATGRNADAQMMLETAISLAANKARYRIELGDFYKRRGRDAESVTLAEKAYLDAVTVEPGSASALMALGVFYRETGRTDKAIEVFRSAVESAPAPLLYQQLVESLVDKGALEAASAEIARMRKIKNTEATADYLQGRVALAESRGSPDKARRAEELFRKITRVQPDFMPAHYYLGVALASRGMLDDAAVEFQRALEISPEFSLAAMALAETYMRSFQYDKALTQARDVLSRDSSDFYANLTAGRALAAQGNLSGARSFLAQARSVRPAAVEPYVALANVLSRQGKIEEAIAALEEGAKSVSNVSRLFLAMSAVYLENRQTEKAIERAGAAVSAEPDNASNASFYASLLWQAGRAQDAVEFLARRAAENPSRAEFQTLLGDFQRSMGKETEALESYKRALDINPLDRGALAGRAAALASLGSNAEARRVLESLRKTDPGSPTADIVEARILVAEGKSDAAEALLENSIRQNPTYPEAYYRLAVIQQENHEPDKAIESLNKALKYQPSLVAARLALAQLYYQTRFYEDALREARHVTGTVEADLAAIGRATAIAVGSLIETRRLDEAISQWSSLPPEIRNTGDYMVKLGYLYLVGQEYSRAEEAFRQAVSLPGEPAVALEGLARVHVSQRRFDEAAAATAQALSTNLVPLARVRLLRLAANIALLRGDSDQVAAILSRMREAAGADAALLVETGDAYDALGRAQEALEAYRAALEADPKSSAAGRRIAAALLKNGDLDEAGRVVAATLEAKPGDLDATVLEARILLARDWQAHSAEATVLLKRAIEAKGVKGRDTASARLVLGSIYYRSGQISTAEAEFRKALFEDPTLIAARTNLAKTLAAKRAYEEAGVEVATILAENPANPEAYAILGDIAVAAGDLGTAEANFRKSLAIQKDHAVLRALVEVLRKSGKSGQAAAEVADYLEAVPADAEAARLLAAIHEEDKNYAAAEEILRQLVTSNPNDSAGVLALARMYKDQGRLGEAGALLESAIERNPVPLMYRYLAGVETLEGKSYDAEATLRAGIKQFPDYKDAYDDLASLLATAGRNEEAIAVLSSGIAANPGKEEFHRSLGAFYIGRGMENEAGKFLKETVRENPKFTGVQLMLGNLYLTRGQKREALETFENAAKYAPEDPLAANALAYVLADDGADAGRAVRLASFAAGKLPNNPDVLDTLGWAYYRDGQSANAVATLARAAELSGAPSTTILCHLALAYSKVGASERARETARKLVEQDGSFGENDEIKRILATE